MKLAIKISAITPRDFYRYILNAIQNASEDRVVVLLII